MTDGTVEKLIQRFTTLANAAAELKDINEPLGYMAHSAQELAYRNAAELLAVWRNT